MLLEGAAASERAVLAGKSPGWDFRPRARGRVDIGICLREQPAAEGLDGFETRSIFAIACLSLP